MPDLFALLFFFSSWVGGVSCWERRHPREEGSSAGGRALLRCFISRARLNSSQVRLEIRQMPDFRSCSPFYFRVWRRCSSVFSVIFREGFAFGEGGRRERFGENFETFFWRGGKEWGGTCLPGLAVPDVPP